MSDPLPTTDAASEALAYQPISGWAIAGFATGILFTLLVALSTIVALFQGVPMFFPAWILFLPVAGIVLSLLGQWHVQTSEGTRAGARIARIGLWLSVVSGVGYSSYYFVTGLAVQSQANEFLMTMGEDAGFFPRLYEWAKLDRAQQDPDKARAMLNSAFLLTRPATNRGGRPDDELSMTNIHDVRGKEMMGELSLFRNEGFFPRMFFKQPPEGVKIEPLAVQAWNYEKGSYRVYRNYRIQTKELDWEMTLAVFSTEAETPGQGRKWYLNLRESGAVAKKPTEFGRGVSRLRQYAKLWFDLRFNALNNGDAFAGLKENDKTPWDRLFTRPKERDARRDLVYQALLGPGKHRIVEPKIAARPEDVGRWEQIDGKLRFRFSFHFKLASAPTHGPMFVEGEIVIETLRPMDPATFDDMAPMPEWRLERIVFNGVVPILTPKG